MKIVHVTTSLELGGSERALEGLICADPENEHRVICLHEDGFVGPRLRDKGIQVDSIHLPRHRIPAPQAIARLWRLVRADRADVVQAWMYHSNLLSALVGKAAGARSICWNIRRSGFHEDTLPASTKLVARLGAWLSHFIPDAIIYCAYSAAKWHVEFGYDRNRVEVIQNGIDTDRFSPSAADREAVRRELGIPSDAPLIGSVARFHPDKDHNTLFAAVKHMAATNPGLKCVLVGTGTEPNGPLARLAEQSGITDQMILLGPRTDLPAIMNALDLHVTSSVTEGFPNVIAEAMACGTLCVATEVGDARAVIGDHGWIVPIKSPVLLGDAIAQALSLRETPKWTSLREAARAYCKSQFDIGKMVNAYRDVWSRSARRGRNS
jgi:glycosyltransferase involved in cell wall biosynthesis